MKRCILLITITVALLFLFNTANATTWYVHPDSALNTIQAGLDSCTDNDTVLVGPGTYFENIVWPNTQGIHLISELGPETTIIDGNSNGSVVFCTTSVDTATIIRGFTIQHGGGGIRCWYSSLIIEGNIITDNHAYDIGGGMEIYLGSPRIINTIINANSATGDGGCGGGIYSRTPDTIRIIGSTITNNLAEGIRPGVGGIYCDGAVIIKNSIISSNWFGGIVCGFATIDSCTISNNDGVGVDMGGGSNINHCDIFGNTYGVVNGGPIWVNAEYNWWGDATGPYHPTANPGGLGDSVSDYVDFDPWLTEPGVGEQPVIKPVETHENLTATIFRGPLQLPEGKNCKVFDITGRVVELDRLQPGIYFIEIDGVVTQKVVKVR